MANDETQKLAERIAALLKENENDSGDFASLRSSIEKINERLDKIESKAATQNPQSAISFPRLNHPSQERFAVIEAIADEIIEHLGKEKACAFEPNGKPCDHCAMCSSRGF